MTEQQVATWKRAVLVSQWTCISGDVGEETDQDVYYWSPGEDRAYTSRHICGACQWKFRDDTYWGALYGDTCPNCGSPSFDFED